MGIQASAATRFAGVTLSTVVITSTLARTAEAWVDGVWHGKTRAPSELRPGWGLYAGSWCLYLLGAAAAAVMRPDGASSIGAAMALVILSCLIVVAHQPWNDPGDA